MIRSRSSRSRAARAPLADGAAPAEGIRHALFRTLPGRAIVLGVTIKIAIAGVRLLLGRTPAFLTVVDTVAGLAMAGAPPALKALGGKNCGSLRRAALSLFRGVMQGQRAFFDDSHQTVGLREDHADRNRLDPPSPPRRRAHSPGLRRPLEHRLRRRPRREFSLHGIGRPRLGQKQIRGALVSDGLGLRAGSENSVAAASAAFQ